MHFAPGLALQLSGLPRRSLNQICSRLRLACQASGAGQRACQAAPQSAPREDAANLHLALVMRVWSSALLLAALCALDTCKV